MTDKKFLINSKVLLIDKMALEKFKIHPKTIGRVTRIYYDRVTVEFIQDNQRTTLNLFNDQLKLKK